MNMKNIYMCVLLLAVTFSLKAQSISRFEQKEDSVYLNMNMGLAGKTLKSRSSLELTPILRAGINAIEFPKVILKGRNSYKQYRREIALNNYKGDPYSPVIKLTRKQVKTINYSATIPFAQWMSSAELELRSTLSSCPNNPEISTTQIIADGMTLEPKIQEPEVIIIVIDTVKPLAVVKEYIIHGTVYLDFVVGGSELLKDYKNNNAELKKISEMIDSTKNISNIQITAMEITGFSSPEGNYEYNAKLASARSEALCSYLKAKYDIPSNMVSVKSVAEDWIGLKKMVEASEMDYKSEVLAIINSNDSDAIKDSKIANLAGGAPYRYMLKNFYPKLRKVEYQIDYIIN